ncbi:hypothetical protein EDD75_0207 [Thermodesulfitimonas autotrophica]|uniref:Uncharacterized protein n=1 Tax=Thermodesulfitimonas autotrophica TaxID=1894989 RepID=A0A3N5AWU4_9THEO|nr:hypothetical protein EDD75_0207 [Thermodesulfitimonas autotrophica]
MIRKQIYIAPHQEALLKRKARALGLAEAELVRQALEKHLCAGESIRPNPDAWEAEKRFIRSRMKLAQGGTRKERHWRREELYDR